MERKIPKPKKQNKPNWIQRKIFKRTITKAKKDIEKIQQRTEKQEKEEVERIRGKILNAVKELSEICTLEEDNGEPISKERLEKKDTDELIEIYTKILEEAEKLVRCNKT